MKISNKRIERFAEKLAEEEKSRATIEKYIRDVRTFALYANGCSLNKCLVMDYKSKLKTKYSLTSANSMLASINAFLRFLGKSDMTVRQFKVQKKTFCSESSNLTKDEYIALVKAAEERKNIRLSLLIQTVCGTGIRISELKYITVEAVKRGEATVNCKGKTRNVFIVLPLRKKLLQYAKARGITKGSIFVSRNGNPLDRTNIWHDMKNICKHANVDPQKVFPHNLRHLFARTFYNKEKDIAKLADILGHSSINTTRIYIVSTGREHSKMVEQMRLII